ncbi:cytochrome P450 [Mycena metata]|uniref:Cytochrome P450 n=1 Tax=Mycena metata TaxID=1033252 RepID=A0AAD7JRM6_9AGAR|nr:cytochrome P450 [Mycena metata]
MPNAAEMPFKFMEWSRKYGEIVSVKICSSTMIILSSPRAIKVVVDKQGWATSSRPANYLAGLAAGGYHILFARDAPRLRNLKNAIARFFSPTNSLGRVPVQAAESTQLLQELMTQPEVPYSFRLKGNSANEQNFIASIRRYTHSVAMITTYGQRVPSLTSPQMQGFYQMLHRFLHVQLLGVYPPINLVPVLSQSSG